MENLRLATLCDKRMADAMVADLVQYLEDNFESVVLPTPDSFVISCGDTHEYWQYWLVELPTSLVAMYDVACAFTSGWGYRDARD